MHIEELFNSQVKDVEDFEATHVQHVPVIASYRIEIKE